MKKLIIAIALSAFGSPAFAQGQGGYPSNSTDARVNADGSVSTQTKGTKGDPAIGAGSIDTSGRTDQGGRTNEGAQGTANQALGAHAASASGGTKTTEPSR